MRYPCARFPLPALWIFAALLAAAPMPGARADGSFFERFFSHDVEVITVTDTMPAGRQLRRPSRAHPLYYEVLVIGYQDFGRSIAGLDVPPKKEMLKIILKLLADQGYYPATPAHPPEMLLAFAWGTMNRHMGMALAFMGGEKLDLMWELEPLSIGNSAQALTRFRQSPLASLIKDAAQGDLYVISIQAFDEAEAVQGRTKLLWHTKVSCPATGLGMTSTLKEMARQAAPYFGRETGKPVWVTAPPRDGHVDLGELRILEKIDPNKLPITDVDSGPDAVGPAARQKHKSEGR